MEGAVALRQRQFAGVELSQFADGWASDKPFVMSPETARELAAELLSAALSAKFASGGLG